MVHQILSKDFVEFTLKSFLAQLVSYLLTFSAVFAPRNFAPLDLEIFLDRKAFPFSLICLFKFCSLGSPEILHGPKAFPPSFILDFFTFLWLSPPNFESLDLMRSHCILKLSYTLLFWFLHFSLICPSKFCTLGSQEILHGPKAFLPTFIFDIFTFLSICAIPNFAPLNLKRSYMVLSFLAHFYFWFLHFSMFALPNFAPLDLKRHPYDRSESSQRLLYSSIQISSC